MSTDDTPETESNVPAALPVLPLRDVVVYPHMVIPLFVGREKSIHALDVAMKADKRIMLIAQKQPDVDDPKADDLYRIGTVATILQLLKLPDGTVKVLVEGVDRARIDTMPARISPSWQRNTPRTALPRMVASSGSSRSRTSREHLATPCSV